MDKRKLVESLIDDLSMMLKRKFDSLEYDKQYRRIVGHERDPMLKYMEIQFAAGAIFTGVYFGISRRDLIYKPPHHHTTHTILR